MHNKNESRRDDDSYGTATRARIKQIDSIKIETSYKFVNNKREGRQTTDNYGTSTSKQTNTQADLLSQSGAASQRG